MNTFGVITEKLQPRIVNLEDIDIYAEKTFIDYYYEAVRFRRQRRLSDLSRKFDLHCMYKTSYYISTNAEYNRNRTIFAITATNNIRILFWRFNECYCESYDCVEISMFDDKVEQLISNSIETALTAIADETEARLIHEINKL